MMWYGKGETAMVTFGLIGCGRIGQMHSQILMKNARATLGAVYDLNKELSKMIHCELND